MKKSKIDIFEFLDEAGNYICPYCKKQYSKMGIGTHI